MTVLLAKDIARVEKEEGKTFLQVLAELAASGESRSSAAVLLDISQTSFCKWARSMPEVMAISWPKKGQSNGFLENVRTVTPARQAASTRNLKKIHDKKKKPA